MAGLFSSPNVAWVAAATFAALAAGTVVRLAALRHAAKDVVRSRLGSLKIWWLVAVVVVAAAVLGRAVAAFLFTVVSAMSMYEFVRLSKDETTGRKLVFAVFALIPINYLWIGLGWSQVFVPFLPLTVVLLSGVLFLVGGRTEGFTRRVSRTCFGMLLTVYLPAHAVLLFNLPPESNPVAGVAGWFLLLVILTESNDITQALIGRRVGRRKITPRVSPNKTWEGFLGGIASTVLLAVLLGQWLTPLGYLESAVAGLVIALAGFFGDLNMSAIKRDAGVKDSSQLLPGQGGILDRIDSLTFSAPVFYYFVLLLA